MEKLFKKRNKLSGVLVAGSMLIALSGCASMADYFSSTKNQKPERDNLQLVALDFVNAISQINTMHPSSGMLRFHDATSSGALNSRLKSAMQSAGYQIETVANPDAINLVSNRVSQSISEASGDTYIYEVSVGNVSFRRTYELSDSGTITPATGMYVKGGDVSTIKLDDSIFIVD